MREQIRTPKVFRQGPLTCGYDNHQPNPLHDGLTMCPDEGFLVLSDNTSRRKQTLTTNSTDLVTSLAVLLLCHYDVTPKVKQP